VPQVGGLDMLRFRDFTVGKGWQSDYISIDNGDEFKALLAYSRYQNGKYCRCTAANSLRPCSTRIRRTS
jgi:prolyl oligopeptidase